MYCLRCHKNDLNEMNAMGTIAETPIVCIISISKLILIEYSAYVD